MKFCPHCNEKISYSTLMKYTSGKGFVKHEYCPHCRKMYKVTMNPIFMLIFFIAAIALLIFVFKPSSRLSSRLLALAIVLLATPLFPFFMKLSEED